VPASLKFKLDARQQGEAVGFDAFAVLTVHVAAILAEIDALETGGTTVRWVIRDLKVGSAEVAIEAVPLNPMFDTSARVARQFTRGLEYVARQGARPDWFSEAAWDEARAVVAVLHDGVGRVSIQLDGDEGVVLTSDLELAESEAQAPIEIGEQEAITTIEGSLDTIFGHDPRQLAFAVWDVLYRRRVRCEFTPELVEQVKRGVWERVRVHGLVRFDRLGRPVRVQVQSIEVLPRTVTRPTAAALRGLVRGLTGGVPSEVWVRQMRDA
jgi:hypothetical protein